MWLKFMFEHSVKREKSLSLNICFVYHHSQHFITSNDKETHKSCHCDHRLNSSAPGVLLSRVCKSAQSAGCFTDIGSENVQQCNSSNNEQLSLGLEYLTQVMKLCNLSSSAHLDTHMNTQGRMTSEEIPNVCTSSSPLHGFPS